MAETAEMTESLQNEVPTHNKLHPLTKPHGINSTYSKEQTEFQTQCGSHA